ncbi:hypothetical protein ACK1CN_01345 [Vibrio coralliilyticus]|uniref:hypothetical protein n=1 Tax=Vibrio coralliilyticus TaxID=190893 RepID=UPI0039170609
MFKESMQAYHVEITNQTNLNQLNDGRFQMIKQGRLDPVMVGYKYVLVKNTIAEILKKLDIQGVTFKPATIWNRKEDIEDHSYTQLEVNQHFDSANTNDLDLSGLQFLVMDNRYLFVSPELMLKLGNSGIKWAFSKGFSNFG